MAATAMAAVGPSLGIPQTTITTKHLKLNHTTTTLLHLHSPLLLFRNKSLSHNWRPSRVSETVFEAQAEEKVAEVAVEQEVGEEVAEVGEEVAEVAEVAVEQEVSEEVAEVAGEEVSTKLYIGNLPYHCDSAQLAGIVQDYGIPELVEVLYNRDTGRSRGFAFVTMSTIEDCNAVIDNLDGSEYGGRYLRVNFADKPRKKEPLFPETEHKLFIGNLSWSVTSESLYEAFQGYGNIVGARVLHDGETGKSRGYGFVCYATRVEMENALASLNGMELEGRAMRVSLAEGKKL